MFQQYNAQRFRQLPDGRRVGTLKPGTILYIQNNVRPFADFQQPTTRQNPWIIECWMNRTNLGRYHAGGHLAQVRSLRDGRRTLVSDWILLRCADAGLEKH